MRAEPIIERRFAAMGTRVHVIVSGGPADLVLRARDRIDQLEQRWSRFRATSEIAELNRSAGRPVVVSRDTWVLVSRAVQAWHLSGGVFDPTVLDAMEANGYDRTFARVPSGPAAAPVPVGKQTVPAAGCAGIELDDRIRSVRLPEGVRIDPGGIGKGLAADMVAAELVRAGARGALVNLGGDMVAAGEAPLGDRWVVEVEESTICPVPLATVAFERGGLATSVTTRRRWAGADGERHHLVDPASGAPTRTGTVLATALACEGWLAEIAATARVVGRVSPALASVPSLVLSGDGRLEAHGGFHHHLVGLGSAGPDTGLGGAAAPSEVSTP